MTRSAPFLLLLCAALASTPALAQSGNAQDGKAVRDLAEFKAMLPGIYANEEQVAFYDLLGVPEAERLPRLTLHIEPDGEGFKATTTSQTGRETEARLEYRVEDGAIRSREMRTGQPDCERDFAREFESYRGTTEQSGNCGGVVVASPEGFRFGDPARPFDMLRARPFTCWMMPQRTNGEYKLYTDLVLHDQGGRIWIEASEDHPRVGIRLRSVRWPSGDNRDSLVLYTYRGDDEDKAVSYTWTATDAERLAINTRWLQVSCTAGATSITPNVNLKTGSGK